MNRFRKIIFIGGLLAAVMAAAPTLASASSLLSGYGGPGQGNQAILGSTLLNGPSGGGGSGGGAGGGSSGGGSAASGGGAEGAGGSSTNTARSTTGGETAASGSATGAPGGSGAGSGNSGTGGGTAGAHDAGGSRAGSAPRKAVAAASLYPASERLPASQQTGTLGLSTADLLYIILAAGTLAFVGVFTSRLTRTDAPGRQR